MIWYRLGVERQDMRAVREQLKAHGMPSTASYPGYLWVSVESERQATIMRLLAPGTVEEYGSFSNVVKPSVESASHK